jgi:hypothetical protein
VVLIVLALVWAVVLGPSLLRRLLDRQSRDSIGSFHHHLHVLGRTGPELVAPAHRLDLPQSSRGEGTSWFPAGALGGTTRANRLGPASLLTMRRPDPYFRPEACKRRRDVFMVLICLLFVTGLMGVIPKLHLLLAVTAFFAALLIIYVGFLVRLRSHAIEREAKLRYLHRPTGLEPTITVRRAASR